MEHLFTKPIDAFDFMMAGNSIVTFKSTNTGNHFTYKVKRAKDRNIRFVSVLYGDNNSAYSYIGMLNEQGQFFHTKGSKCAPDAISFKIFEWAWNYIRCLYVPSNLEIWHEGRCGRCGRRLTEPESIACGLGPVCRNK